MMAMVPMNVDAVAKEIYNTCKCRLRHDCVYAKCSCSLERQDSATQYNERDIKTASIETQERAIRKKFVQEKIKRKADELRKKRISTQKMEEAAQVEVQKSKEVKRIRKKSPPMPGLDVCWNCVRRAKKKCPYCFAAVYCSENCKIENWNLHFEFCTARIAQNTPGTADIESSSASNDAFYINLFDLSYFDA